MLISKNHLLTLHTTSKDDTRPLLKQIKVFRQGEYVVAVSTDSYILSEVREKVPDDADYPLAEEDMNGSEVADEIYFEADTAKRLKPYMKNDKVLPILSYAQAHKDGVFATTLDKSIKLYAKPVDGEYPDYERLLPAAQDEPVLVNPKLLRKALAVFNADDEAVSIEIKTDPKTGKPDKYAPVVLRSVNTQIKKLAVVMPVRN